MATQEEKDAAGLLLDGVRDGFNGSLGAVNAALPLLASDSAIDLSALSIAYAKITTAMNAIHRPYDAARAAVAALPIEPSTDPIIVVFGVEAA